MMSAHSLKNLSREYFIILKPDIPTKFLIQGLYQLALILMINAHQQMVQRTKQVCIITKPGW